METKSSISILGLSLVVSGTLSSVLFILDVLVNKAPFSYFSLLTGVGFILMGVDISLRKKRLTLSTPSVDILASNKNMETKSFLSILKTALIILGLLYGVFLIVDILLTRPHFSSGNLLLFTTFFLLLVNYIPVKKQDSSAK